MVHHDICDRAAALSRLSVRSEQSFSGKCQIYVVAAWVQPIRLIWYLSTYGSPILALQTQGSICLLQFILDVTLH